MLKLALRTVGFALILLSVVTFVYTLVKYLNINTPNIKPWNIGNLLPSVFQLFAGVALGLLCLFADQKLTPFDINNDPSVFGDKE